MPKTQTTKHSVNLREGDYEALQDYVQGKPVHASDIIRTLVSRFVDTRINTPVDVQKLKEIPMGDL